MIRTYYLIEGGNWGDVFTPFLFEKLYSIKLHRVTSPADAELVSTGSVLDLMPESYTGHVLGSGMMDCDEKPRDFTRASVHLLRGKLTRKNCVTSSEPLLGDPGMLAYLFANQTEPIYDFGLIPHYVEKANEQVIEWGRKAHVINVQAGVQVVIDEALKCRKIVSSSLHGLILSDALGIPNHMVVLHDPRVWQRGFKFNDYYSVYDETANPVRNIDEAFGLCRTRDTQKVKADVKLAFDNFAAGVK
jgi:pyruvyltransferase